MFKTTARYALVLAFALGLFHFNGASARAEKCSPAAADDTGGFFSPVSLSDAPHSLRGNTPDKRIGRDSSFVRFSVRSRFMVSGSAVTYSARSLHEAVATVDDEMCGSMLKVTARSQGTASIKVTASANGVTETDTLTVEVDPNAVFAPPSSTNSAPVAEGTIADTTFTQNTSPISFFVSPYFSDPDGDDLTYTAGLSRAGIVDTSITDSTLTLTALSKGTATVTVTATDRGGLSVTQSFQATIENSPPDTVGAIPDMTVAVGDSLVIDVSEYFEDPDPDDTLTYAVYRSPNVSITRSGDANTVTIHGGETGPATLVVVATDEDDEDAPHQVFTVQVVEGNRSPRPEGTIPTQTLTLGGASVIIDVSDYFTDPDPQDTLSYAVSAPGIVTATIPEDDSTLTITPVSAGTGRVTVTARDLGNLTATQAFTVTVRDTTGATDPLAVGITGPTLINSGVDSTWEASATGGVQPYTYSWYYATECIDVPTRAPDSCLWQWISADTESSTFTRAITTADTLAGVRVTATDRATPTPSSVSSSVTVPVNHGPVAEGTIGARTITLGHPDVSFSVARFFSDADPDDQLDYSARSSNTSNVGVSISGSTLTLSAEAVNTTPDTVTVTATDKGHLTATQKFPVTVVDPPDLTASITGPTSIESGTSNTWGLRLRAARLPTRTAGAMRRAA